MVPPAAQENHLLEFWLNDMLQKAPEVAGTADAENMPPGLEAVGLDRFVLVSIEEFDKIYA